MMSVCNQLAGCVIKFEQNVVYLTTMCLVDAMLKLNLSVIPVKSENVLPFNQLSFVR